MLTEASGVFDTDAREFWPYVMPLYVGGLSALLLIGGLAMVFQPWTGRKGLGITGVVLVVLSFVAGSFATTLWEGAERGTADRLTLTAFPFDDQYLTCGHAEALLTDEYGQEWLYQVWTARIENSDIGSSDCNRLNVYQGWQQVSSTDLPAGLMLTDIPVFVSGTTTADAVFQYVQSDGQTLQLTLGAQ